MWSPYSKGSLQRCPLCDTSAGGVEVPAKIHSFCPCLLHYWSLLMHTCQVSDARQDRRSWAVRVLRGSRIQCAEELLWVNALNQSESQDRGGPGTVSELHAVRWTLIGQVADSDWLLSGLEHQLSAPYCPASPLLINY